MHGKKRVLSLGKKGVNQRILLTIVLFFILVTAISFLSTTTPTGLTTADDKYADLFAAAGNETPEEAEPLPPEPVPEPTPEPEPAPEPASLQPTAINLTTFIRQHVPKDLWDVYDRIVPPMEEEPDYGEQAFSPPEPAPTPTATTNITSCIGAISGSGFANGDTVNVTQNLTHNLAGGSCIIMDVDITTLECNGFTITGSGLAVDGVAITASNVVVRNCIIKDLPSADSDAIIVSTGGDNSQLINNTLFNNTDDGIQVSVASGGSIINNTIFNNGGEGIIVFDSSSDINITDNTIYNNTAVATSGQISIGRSGLAEVGDDFIIARNNITTSSSDLLNYLGDDSGGSTSSSGLDILNNSFNYFGSGNQIIDGDRFDNVLFSGNTQAGSSASSAFDNGINITLRNNTVNGTLFSFGFSRTVTNLLIEKNTWLTDLDTTTSTSLAVSALTADGVTIRDHDNVFMSLNCFTCHNTSIETNNLTENAQAAGSGINHNITRNRWEDLELFGGQSAGARTSQPTLFTNDVTISDNVLTSGRMFSILVGGDNVVVDNNTIANLSGQGIDVRASFVNVTNNTFYNFSGIAIRVRENDTRVTNNNLTFIIETEDNQFNFNTTTPQIPEGSVAFRLDNLTNRINISQNTITVLNPNSLEVGILGVDVAGTDSSHFADNQFTGTKIGMFLRNSIRSTLLDNTLSNSTHKGMIIEAGRENTIRGNRIQGTDNTIPSLYESGIQLYRTMLNDILFTNVTDYHTGIHLLNSSRNELDNLTITNAPGHGIFSVQSNTNNYTGINASTDVRTGIKLLFSNSSIINASTFVNTFRSIDLHQSYFNTIDGTTLDGALYGLGLDMFSSNNTVNNNIFGASIGITDILFDMFATGNTGTGNGGPTTTSENGATGNAIT